MSKIKFVLTCGACPEQYDLLEDGEIIAYFRLRWGRFKVECPDIGGERVYSYTWDDEWKGAFDDQDERDEHLRAAFQKISEHYGREIIYPEQETAEQWGRFVEGL